MATVSKTTIKIILQGLADLIKEQMRFAYTKVHKEEQK